VSLVSVSTISSSIVCLVDVDPCSTRRLRLLLQGTWKATQHHRQSQACLSSRLGSWSFIPLSTRSSPASRSLSINISDTNVQQSIYRHHLGLIFFATTSSTRPSSVVSVFALRSPHNRIYLRHLFGIFRLRHNHDLAVVLYTLVDSKLTTISVNFVQTYSTHSDPQFIIGTISPTILFARRLTISVRSRP
jgi:hypothetical protein